MQDTKKSLFLKTNNKNIERNKNIDVNINEPTMPIKFKYSRQNNADQEATKNGRRTN